MKRLTLELTTQSASLVLALTGLSLAASSKSASADGFFRYDGTTVLTQTQSPFIPGSSSNVSTGPTCSVSSYSYYSAQSFGPITSASVFLTVRQNFVWVDNGATPSASGNYVESITGSFDGSASPSGAKAESSPGLITPPMDAPPGYSKSVFSPRTEDLSEFTADDILFGLDASTFAGPDNTADPQDENYGQPTAAAAGVSLGASITSVPV